MELTRWQDQNIIKLLPDCLEFIDQAISTGGSVLVHCGGEWLDREPIHSHMDVDRALTYHIGGILLSPAIVVAYLMVKHNWSFDVGLSFVQSKRYCVSPITVSLIHSPSLSTMSRSTLNLDH